MPFSCKSENRKKKPPLNLTAIEIQQPHITAIASYPIFPSKMGGQKGIASFYRALSRKLRVSLVSVKNNETPDNLQAEFLPVLSDSKSRYFNPMLIFQIRKILKKRKSTHLIIEHPYYGWLGILLKWTTKIRLVVHSHNIEALRFKSTGKWWWGLLWHYERFTHRQADINFFISDEDRLFAISKFGLHTDRCHTITYGFDFSEPPTAEEKTSARKKLISQYGIAEENRILLFNGTLDYMPNLDALKNIIYHINPILRTANNFQYTILVCGKNLPAAMNNLETERANNVIYAGFVDDITLFFKGSDMFINPVTEGGGIKTKLVEALGYNLTCISTDEGAIGVPESITGNKLKIIADKNWPAFAEAIIGTDPLLGKTGKLFFEHFYWDNIASKASMAIVKDQSL